MKLTVFFDGSFWCGLVEYVNLAQEYRVLRYVFGHEPKDTDIFDFIFFILPKLIEANDVLKFSNAESEVTKQQQKISPKRMQRIISRQKRQPIVSTKAQAALKAVHEAGKTMRTKQKRQDKEALKKQKFAQKQAKKYQKHKGH